VVTVYDMIHELFPSSFSKYDQTRKSKLHAVKRADHVICISESTRRDLLRYVDIPDSKVSVVHLGHSLAASSANVDAKTRLASKPYLLYVGQRGGYKNFEGFLRAYAASPALQDQFTVLCFGGGDITQSERAFARSLNVSPTKIVHASGGDASLARAYASAAAFVYPSLYEGFGIPPIEAMSHGCPVIASNTSSIPEVVGDAAELFDPNDLRDMQNAIERVVFSKERAQQLVAKGSERVKDFTWEACALATLNVYRRIQET
jgi:glycosyltransferase involved in cell wall biosynthesis